MIHGFAKTTGGKAYLAFSPTAPILCDKDAPVRNLVESGPEDPVVGYTVFCPSDVRDKFSRGFLWYDRVMAEEEARHLTEMFAKEYVCVALAVQL